MLSLFFLFHLVCFLVFFFFFFLMIRRPPRFTRTDTLFPYTTLCRSDAGQRISGRLHAFAATLSGAVDRDRRDAAEAQRQERLAAERTREQAQERQQAQDREKVAEKFRTIAG